MKLMKLMYYANLVLLIILTITIYLDNNSLVWLVSMLMAYALQFWGVYIEQKREE